MNIEEMVKRCKISDCEDGRIRISESNLAKKENAVDEIRTKKLEIIAYLREKKTMEKKAAEERAAKIAAIEGLEEIRKARADMKNWCNEFNKSFKGEYAIGGLGVRPKPKYDFDAMYAKYPIARDYLRDETQANKSNYVLAAIGRGALEAIIENPANHEEIIAGMEQEIKEFAERHLFD